MATNAAHEAARLCKAMLPRIGPPYAIGDVVDCGLARQGKIVGRTFEAEPRYDVLVGRDVVKCVPADLLRLLRRVR